MSQRLFDDFIVMDKVPVMIKTIGNNSYDYNFRNFIDCKSVVDGLPTPVILRVGAIADYDELTKSINDMGFKLAVSSVEHERASELSAWYPLIKEFTPYSRVYKTLPDIDEILTEFSFPFFVKGNRQTNKHSKKLCIIENREMYSNLKDIWKTDPILHWQDVVIREYVQLKKVDTTSFPDMVPFSYEFRLFFWKNKLVTYGAYWTMGVQYDLKESEKRDAFSLAQTVAERIDVPFLAVDIAKTQSGEWIVIEVNDAQESGYVGVDREKLWRNIIEIEK